MVYPVHESVMIPITLYNFQSAGVSDIPRPGTHKDCILSITLLQALPVSASPAWINHLIFNLHELQIVEE
jgi:hypothetical protein